MRAYGLQTQQEVDVPGLGQVLSALLRMRQVMLVLLMRGCECQIRDEVVPCLRVVVRVFVLVRQRLVHRCDGREVLGEGRICFDVVQDVGEHRAVVQVVSRQNEAKVGRKEVEITNSFSDSTLFKRSRAMFSSDLRFALS